MAKATYLRHSQNFKDQTILDQIDKVIATSKNRYFSRNDFVEVAVKKLLAKEKAASKPRK
jgi:metal-responsive CopG/Arc/MetJ family transcriptional regulator